MIQQASKSLADLYEADETAWLDAMAELIQQGRHGELDFAHLAEYLADMARRDRREVRSRLTTLIAHLLKWTYQADRRSGGWRSTIVVQRQELEDELGSGVLRNYAEEVLAQAYERAVERAAAEMGLPAATLPMECPYALEQLLSPDIIPD